MRWFKELFARPAGKKKNAFEDSSLERRSLELNHNRIDTRRCSLDNTPCQPAQRSKLEHEELHAVAECVRTDSITLAKRRISHEQHHHAHQEEDGSHQRHRTDSYDSLPDQEHAPHIVRWASDVSSNSS